MSRPAIAYINLNHLRHNYRLLTQRSTGASVMAIIKANGYGHGQALIAPVLLAEGCRHFGVTDACEGAQLRKLLAAAGSGEESTIAMLAGIYDKEDAGLATAHALTPAITDSAQIGLLKEAGFHGSVWIKIDTGMNRLGAEQPQLLIKQCHDSAIAVRGIMSHLACADEPDHPMNRQQAASFSSQCRQIDPQLPRSLLNSAGIITMPEEAGDIVRPGLALYGIEPLPAMPVGLKPVMTLTGAIVQVRNIPAGASISYGASFTARQPMRIAVVSLGYADGLPRGLSNKGQAFLRGQTLPVVGRVCMDYTMLDITGTDAEQGDYVEFWGENISAGDVAGALDTISYTLFTGIGERVTRLAV
ncbi:alanine racemase [Mariprofundus erugo]|uniref:Alanine racemase n=1 Tax=Mariprofundus erugo TaxID=2528639 RepID=A0A5R9H2S4_9PROT|nr:alanine racemase [Mariprofundus erugo]TLS69024.1 alanine racemase [Mariprofundus erugo]